jgi:hypothetical protein
MSSAETVNADTSTEVAMTRRDRDDLQKVVRMRERLAKAGIAAQEAELLADVERQLSAIYSANDEAWAEITAAAMKAVADADAQIAQRCEDLGIQPEFRPELRVGWYGRGQNMVASRRAELRKAAQTRIAASGKAAKLAIEEQSLRVLTNIITGGLESVEARQQIASLPMPSDLMPRLDVTALEPAPLALRERRRAVLE